MGLRKERDVTRPDMKMSLISHSFGGMPPHFSLTFSSVCPLAPGEIIKMPVPQLIKLESLGIKLDFICFFVSVSSTGGSKEQER